ncbi:DEAD/DEAH box helicase [Patescibacteria group bacterium]|nr:MAG: DEAD/DEAH box helicase [Patescibacteria group bacterium]
MAQAMQPAGARFADLGVAPSLLNILDKLNYTEATPIQHQCIPLALDGKDVVGIAQTGTGKTLAFGLPMIQRLGRTGGQGLILLPTRELALQVEEVLQKVGRSIGLRTAVLIGGAASYQQIAMLRKNPHVVVSTPGRLLDHLERKNYSLKDVRMVVLDEADRMLDIGFMPQIKKIMAGVPTDRQTMLFSATMPKEIADIAARYMRIPIRIEVAPAGTAAETVEQEIFVVPREGKLQLLDKMLGESRGTVLVFSRTKHGAKKITKSVRDMGHTAAEIHSNRSLAQRRDALEGFKTGRYRILIATDIAARGIDVQGISLVINYDLPDNLEDYVHRIGRTGRAGSYGKAVSFATPDQRGDIRYIERLIRKTIPVLSLPTLPPRRAVVAEQQSSARPFVSARPNRDQHRRPSGPRGGERRRSRFRS